MMANVVEITDLSKDYGDFRLKDISFALPEGYIMGLIGPNGAGKTTIIKLIMNLIMKDNGQVKVFGKDHVVHEVEIKSRIGFVYDNPNYYDHLTLKQFKGVIAPFYPRWDDAMFNRLVAQFGLPLKKAIKKFSRGMVMKAALAVALSHDADLIIMDEPTSGLDPVFRRELLDLLADLMQDENKSVLFSTHITSDLERIADYITFIDQGEVIFSKSRDEVLDKYGIVKGSKDLLGDKAMAGFTGLRLNAYGFEAMTDDIQAARRQFPEGVVVEKASLEDIMFFTGRARRQDVQVDS